MLSDDKIETFLKVAIERTQKDAMHWKVSMYAHQEFEVEEEPVANVYTTTVGERVLRLAQVKYRYWRDEDIWEWGSHIVLDFVDPLGKSLWRFPSVSALRELYDIVRFKTSGASDAIDAFLQGHN